MKKSIIFVLLIVALLTVLYEVMYKSTPEIKTASQAIASVKKVYSGYEGYPSDTPLFTRIEAVETQEGWRVGMYASGSTLPGILKADCFLVTKSGEVTKTGFFSGEGPAQAINLTTCVPKE